MISGTVSKFQKKASEFNSEFAAVLHFSKEVGQGNVAVITILHGEAASCDIGCMLIPPRNTVLVTWRTPFGTASTIALPQPIFFPLKVVAIFFLFFKLPVATFVLSFTSIFLPEYISIKLTTF